MRKSLIIFIDSLPYYKIGDSYLSRLGKVLPLTPGIGYSLNIYPILFAGLTPDQLGVFNEWFPRNRSDEMGVLQEHLFRILDCSRPLPLISRIFHILYSKIMKQHNLGNIPFKYLRYFAAKSSMDIFFEKRIATIFNTYNLSIILSPAFNEGKGRNDFRAYEMALKEIRNSRNVFVMLGDLDNIAHTYGMNSSKYSNRIKELDFMCEKLVQEFRGINGNESEVIILSDHGMVEVKKYVHVDPEDLLGKASPDRYLYFIDATFLRLWVRDRALKERIEVYLSNLKCGNLLDKDARRKYGIENPAFGDFLYLLDEGNVFFPDFMGGRHVKAMHGYLPELQSQKGIFIHLENDPKLDAIGALEAYHRIDSSLSSSALFKRGCGS